MVLGIKSVTALIATRPLSASRHGGAIANTMYEQTRKTARGAIIVKGKPCFYGHDGWRYLTNGHCIECRQNSNSIGNAKRVTPGAKKPRLRVSAPRPKGTPAQPVELRTQFSASELSVHQERYLYTEPPKKHWSPSGFIAPITKERLMSGR